MSKLNIIIEKLGIDFSVEVSDKMAKRILVMSLSEKKDLPKKEESKPE